MAAHRERRQRLQAERIFAGGNHRHRKRRLAHFAVEILLRQPRAQARIANLGRAIPEVGREAALYLQMVELKLDDRVVPGEIPACVRSADFEAYDFTAFVVGFYHHAVFRVVGDGRPVRISGVCWSQGKKIIHG